MSEFLVVAGMSGAGRSTAAATLEDLGWFVIDNLPPALFTKVAELVGRPGSETDRVALVIGRGGGENLADVLPVLDSLVEARHHVQVLFLDAPDDVLVRRFEGTRRRHPLAARGVEESISDERRLLEVVRGRADVILDTGELNSNQLRQRILELFGRARRRGPHADLGAVVRLQARHPPRRRHRLRLPLPSQPLLDRVASAALRTRPAGAPVRVRAARDDGLLDQVDELLAMLLPAFVREGKSYLTVAMGCTGGRHRSVVLADALDERLAAHGVGPRSSTGTWTGEPVPPPGWWRWAAVTGPRSPSGPPPYTPIHGHGLGGRRRWFSGRLRELFDVVALGDIRKCLVALADPSSALALAFEHRFGNGELAGHALGNLVLAGLVEATGDLVGDRRRGGLLGRADGCSRPRPRR